MKELPETHKMRGQPSPYHDIWRSYVDLNFPYPKKLGPKNSMGLFLQSHPGKIQQRDGRVAHPEIKIGATPNTFGGDRNLQ